MMPGAAEAAIAALADPPERARVAAMVDALLAESLYWFPIRHHSPMAAHLLQQTIAQRQPRLLFIEAPAGLESLLPLLTDPQTRPPVALYSSFRDDLFQLRRAEQNPEPLRLASWYPLLAYSPEYVAIRAAQSIGAQIVFIDLPQHAQWRPPEIDAPDADQGESDPPALAAQPANAETLYSGLARAAGYSHWDEAWDSLFESAGVPEVERFRRELATFCAAARISTPDQQLAAETLPRERFMWQRIRDGLTELAIAPEQSMVVCGGFHCFMERSSDADCAEPPPGTLQQALVPYSYLRVWERSGYAAGNRAPRFYQRVFESLGDSDPQRALIEQSIAILHQARRKGERVASADAIAVHHHSVLLAQLRGRPGPILDDLNDALISCCVKGDPATDGLQLQRVMREMHVGNKVGRVCAGAGRLPLVSDYYAQLDALELAELLGREQVHTLKLDRRDALDARRSAFLHRLVQLGVPLGQPQQVANDLGHSIFAERWRIQWSAEIETKLIERSLDGDSVVAAAQVGFARELAAAALDAGRCCGLLLQALAMDLPELLLHAQQSAAQAIDSDSRFLSQADALTSLRVLERSAGAELLGAGALFDLLERCWDRACFALPEIANAGVQEHAPIVQALKGLAEVALSRDDLDANLFATYTQTAVALSQVAELRGALLAVLVDIRRLPLSALSDELAAYAQAGAERQLQVGDFLHGVLAVSTTAVMLGAGALVAALDEVIGAADRQAFLAMLPRLRAAIEQLATPQRDALGGALAVHFGLSKHHLDEQLRLGSSGQALIVELDAEVAQIMSRWSFWS